jgi:hypothetical protein
MNDHDEDYFGDVEAYFVERRGSPLFITPSEWYLVSKWEEQGIPLRVVQEGIDRVFERPRTATKPRKLSYCRQTVEAAFRRFREVSLGGGDDRSTGDDPFDAAAHLTRLAAELSTIAPDIAARVETLAHNGDDVSTVEAALTAIEGELVEMVEAELAQSERERIASEAQASLADYRDRMPDKVYQSALKSAYRRRVRELAKLPRLTLYHR